MTEQQQLWFEKLIKDREENAKILEKPSCSGIKNSVVEKYSDQAHFIYELLQNANDARATKSLFQLNTDGLYFKHNGTTLFSVSNPDTEREDKENNILGHVNSITAIANSNKTESSIGKFGVGFKAVFQYTETPHIYDPNFRFRIDRFIVPVKLKSDLQDRKKDETVFYFPFNKAEVSAEKAYSDILEKLKKLVFPTLFLSNLEEVKWNADSETGEYTKKSSKQKKAEDITYEKIELYQQTGLQQTKEKLYLFTRSTDENHNYSIGIFLDEKNKPTPKKSSVFCFFPTKKTTNLNFIIHAPFLLTDSREGVKTFENYNIKMCELLSKLAADSMLILKKLKLINDEIFEIIPYKRPEDDDFFASFYETIKEKFLAEELLPTVNGYTEKENAYWADSPDLASLFSNKQLAELVENQNAQWVFVTIDRKKDKEITEYIDGSYELSWYKKEPNLIKSNIDFENDIADLITSNFIRTQSNEWLHKFYEYLSERKSHQDKFKTKPIFKDSQGNAVAAFDKIEGELHNILFLPLDKENSNYKTIDSALLKNKKTRDFIENFGIKKPNEKDEIYNHILPLYDLNNEVDVKIFLKIFNYWKNKGRPEELISVLKDKEFVYYKTNKDKKIHRGIAKEIYYPTPELVKYFESKPDAKFVDLDDYYSFIKEEKEQKILKEFLLKLGVNETVRVTKKLGNHVIYFADHGCHQRGLNGFDKDILVDGLEEALCNVNFDNSKFIWNKIAVKQSSCIHGTIESATRQDYKNSKKNSQYSEKFGKILKESKWLLSNKRKFVAPSEITIDKLSDGYESNAELEHLLGFKPVVLSENERIASKFESEEEAEEAKKALEEKREKEKRKAKQKTSEITTEVGSEDLEDAIESLENLSKSVSNPKTEKAKTNKLPDFDEHEELTKGIVELTKQLEIKKTRDGLAEKIKDSMKYSYEWFISYLQLLTTYNEKQDIQKQKSISFQEIKLYKDDKKYFLLCGSSSYISPEIENADDFRVSLIFGNRKRETITVEGVSKKGQDLLIYCREPLSGNTISQFSRIIKVEINFTPVIDLLDRLCQAFANANHIEEWDNIQEATPALKFIYGPPGTGKTTEICNEVGGIFAKSSNTKVLVLTPTNKAADVVCKKLKGVHPSVRAIRLSSPTDPTLEGDEIYRDTLDNNDLRTVDVVASTIHRLPYFEIKEVGFLFQYKWDYVIFDESSMIGLHYIVFAVMALFKTNPNTNFIVAGDPKQIPPVVEIDEKELENFDFQDENFFKMMNLESFDSREQERSKREIDTIQNLNKQYRSIPEIGQLFSELSYSSLLEHDRTTNGKKAKKLPERFSKLILSNVTFIDIPLSNDNSIYKLNKLFYSSYHIYSAILVSEIIQYFDNENEREQWTIGLIAPYKAQAMLLNKLITSYGISENLKVMSDTVHGFQGDECDIVFFVCNPNNYFFSNHEKALLSKEYIYNVAISRAKDFLIILHPYSVIQENNFINKIKNSYKANFGNTKILKANDIEKVLFNDRNYIEKNSYFSGHDSVNVFGISEMKYFIKANDTAIDIQLRDLREHKTTNGLVKEIRKNSR
jgi:hypothetical protein